MLTRRNVVLLCLVFAVSLPAVATRLYASDEVEYFAWLRSIAFDRDADFQNEYQHFYDAGVSRSLDFHETFLERKTEINRRVNYATPGSALLWGLVQPARRHHQGPRPVPWDGRFRQPAPPIRFWPWIPRRGPAGLRGLW